MSHFAKVENGVVTEIIVAEQEVIDSGLFGDPSMWVQTSYNTRGNQHLKGGEPLRKNYAGIGYHYDGVGFYSPSPFASWILNQNTYLWEPPIPFPEDPQNYYWDEDAKNWALNT